MAVVEERWTILYLIHFHRIKNIDILISIYASEMATSYFNLLMSGGNKNVTHA